MRLKNYHTSIHIPTAVISNIFIQYSILIFIHWYKKPVRIENDLNKDLNKIHLCRPGPYSH